ncbi:transporter substrate-binding domain-containing protein [Saccharopolyspora cebuensis]|uniref:Transporter substrate-binding domain-containing protein n=1 Tax=Saccharopolyspora cebuensis TaxID=418759 RepID=A0ABV4CPQ7_9PSEU
MRRTALACTILLAFAAGCSATDEPIDVGIKNDQYGLAFYEHDPTAPFGFEITMADALTEELGRAPRHIGVASHVREEWLTAGRVDLMVATMSMAPERLEPGEFDMVGPYLRTHAALLAKTGYTGETDPGRIPVYKICTLRDSTTESYLTTIHDGAGPRTEASVTECLDRLKSGAVDVVATDEIILRGVLLREPGLFTIVNEGFGAAEEYGIGISGSSGIDCRQVERWLMDYVQRDWVDDLGRSFEGSIGDLDEYRVSPTDIDNESTC